MDEYERNIDQIERSIVDPHFKAIMSEISDVNELLMSEPVSEQEATLLVQDFNRRWREYDFYGQQLHISGSVYVGGEYDDVSYAALDEEAKTSFKSYPFTSSGFSLHTRIADEDGAMVFRQTIMARGKVDIADQAGVGNISNVSCVLPLNPETYVEYRTITPARASAWLETYHEDFKAEFDEILLQANDEAEIVMGLKDFEHNLMHLTKKERKELVNYIQTYLIGSVKFDHYVPYVADIHGPLHVYNAEARCYEQKRIESKVLIGINDVLVAYNKERKELDFSLQSQLVNEKYGQARVMQVPLAALQSLKSGRAILDDH